MAALWIAVAVALTLANRGGLTWDGAYYYQPYQDVRGWIGHPSGALSDQGIRAGWESIHELPPVTKWIGALSLCFGGDGWRDLNAMRFVFALCFSGGLWLMVLIGRRVSGKKWCWLAPILLLVQPRITGHAAIAATEAPFFLVTMFVAWCALRNLGPWKNRLLLAAACGVALATKVNGVILIAAVIGWLVLRGILERKRNPAKDDWLAIAAIIIGAPVVALALWPWLWSHPVERIAEYCKFITEHAHQGLWYFGKKWNFDGPLAPPSYPFVISHFTTPISVLVLFWIGIIAGLIRVVRTRHVKRECLLLALLIIAPLAASSLPSSPKYDGIRLFYPMFAPAALLAAAGLRHVAGLISNHPRRMKIGYAIAAILIIGAVADGVRPDIDYYNRAASRIDRDSSVFPFEQTYWGNSVDGEAIAWMNKNLPQNANIKTLALKEDVFVILQGWGLLRADLKFAGEPPYDYHLMQNRRGFWGRAEWAIYTSREPIMAWGRGQRGEPLLYLYDGRPPGE
ncbi:hypothetical protein BH09SUM1_BH09SUM1_04530 [soil metagenome]